MYLKNIKLNYTTIDLTNPLLNRVVWLGKPNKSLESGD